jgi:hypothetical protein
VTWKSRARTSGFFTRGKRYEVLGSLNEAWAVGDSGANNLLDGDDLLNFRVYRRRTTAM